MPEQREEHVLNHVLGLAGAETERGDVAQERGRRSVEQLQHIVLDRSRDERNALHAEQRQIETEPGFNNAMDLGTVRILPEMPSKEEREQNRLCGNVL